MEEKRFVFWSFARLLVSWVLLPVAYGIVLLIGRIGIKFVFWAWSEISILSPAMRIVVILIGGSFFLAVIFYPIFYGAAFTVTASETVYPSKNGTRYIVFATVLLTISILSFALSYIVGTINIACIYVAIYCIFLIVFRQKRDENGNKQKSEPKRPTHSRDELDSFQLVSRYALRNDMSVREYCIYCFSMAEMRAGVEKEAATAKAQKRAASYPDDLNLAYGLVSDYATRNQMTVPEYLKFCAEEERKQAKNLNKK